MTEIEKKVRDAVERVLGEIKDDLWAADTQLDHFGVDSLDRTEIIIELEDEFDETIPDKDANQFKTIGDLIAHFEK
jgi:acyl carrier protein